MKKLKNCAIAVVIIVLGLLFLKRQLDCSNIHLGGTGHTSSACHAPKRVKIERTEQEKQKHREEFMKENQFVCRYEYKPELSAETQQLYNYALYQDLHNMWAGKKNDTVWQNAAVYYRIAAANNDYKANVRLQYLLSTGRIGESAALNAPEVHELNKKLAETLLATAYYNLQGHIERKYGVGGNSNDRWEMLHKAAELGSREAQYVLGESIRSLGDDDTEDLRMELAKNLLKCSAEQGYADAAHRLGIMYQDEEKYTESVQFYHQGVKGGKYLSALTLSDGFSGKYGPKDKSDYLALPKDSERAIRYEMIKTYLSRNDFLDPKVPDLDDIVPLPPAKLPAWDGKIAFQRWFEGPSPEKPSDELMKKLADQAGLDWQTGLPLKK